MILDLCTLVLFPKRNRYCDEENMDFYQMCVIIYVKGLELRDRQGLNQVSSFLLSFIIRVLVSYLITIFSF